MPPIRASVRSALMAACLAAAGCGTSGEDFVAYFGLIGSGSGACSNLTIRVDTLGLFIAGTDPTDISCAPESVFLATCTFDEDTSVSGKVDITFSGPNCTIPDLTDLFSCQMHGSLVDVQNESSLVSDDCDSGTPALCVESEPCAP